MGRRLCTLFALTVSRNPRLAVLHSVAWGLLSFASSAVIGAALVLTLGCSECPQATQLSPGDTRFWVDVAGSVIFAPFVETYLLQAAVYGLRRAEVSSVLSVALCACVAGIVHVLVGRSAMFFLPVVNAFALMTLYSLARAAWATRTNNFLEVTLVHATHNLSIVLWLQVTDGPWS